MAGIAGKGRAGITAKGAGIGTLRRAGRVDIPIPIIAIIRISTAARPQASTSMNGSGRDATGCGTDRERNPIFVQRAGGIYTLRIFIP
jgi:hypothetical protein